MIPKKGLKFEYDILECIKYFRRVAQPLKG